MDSRSIPFPPQILFFLYSTPPSSPPFLVAHRHFRLLHLVPVDSPARSQFHFLPTRSWTLEGLARGIEKVEGNGAHLESEIQQVPPPLLGHPSTGVLSLRGRGFDSPVRRVIPFRPRRSARWGWVRETEPVSYNIREIEKETVILYVDKEGAG